MVVVSFSLRTTCNLPHYINFEFNLIQWACQFLKFLSRRKWFIFFAQKSHYRNEIFINRNKFTILIFPWIKQYPQSQSKNSCIFKRLQSLLHVWMNNLWNNLWNTLDMRWNVVYIALAIILSVSTGFVGQNLKLWANLVPEKILCFFKVSFPSKQLLVS